MEFHLLQSLTILFLVLVPSHASVDSLSNGVGTTISYVLGEPREKFPGYNDAATDEQVLGIKISALFMLEKDIRQGKNVNLHISKDPSSIAPFVPREVAKSLPFTSNKLQDIYKSFKVNPDSIEANLIKKTVKECEKASNQDDDMYCATSLESMVDFASSKLGKRVKASSTQVVGEESSPLHKYRVDDVKKLTGDDVVVCHREYYAYAVHHCHKASKINAYMVSLVGENNVKARAISVCHENTASWNPKHLAFQVLNVGPGTDAVCHFIVEDDVIWF